MTRAFLLRGLFYFRKSHNNFNFAGNLNTTLPGSLTLTDQMIKSYLKSLFFLLLLTSSNLTKGGEIANLINRISGENSFVWPDRKIFSELPANVREVSQSVLSYHLLQPNSDEFKKIIKSKPATLRLTFPDPNSGGYIIVLLSAKDIYSSDFKIMTSDNSKIPYLDKMNYQGIVEGKNNSFAAVSIYENEIMGLICDERGNFNIGKLKNDQQNIHIIYNEKDLTKVNPFVCSTSDDFKTVKNSQRNSNSTSSSNSVNCLNLYWETDQDIFVDKGSTLAVNSYINGLFNQINALYANDGITINLQSLFVWTTSDPYSGPTSGNYLTQFGNNRTSFTGDLAHLIGYDGGGGVAWLDVLCDGSTNYRMGYSGIDATYNNIPTYSWSVEVISHEQGHNMASEHTHDCVWNGNNTAIDGCGPASGYASDPGGCAQGPIPAKGTIMSYCHLSGGNGINLALGFGAQPLALILSRINSASCLSPCSAPGIANDEPCDATVLTTGSTCSQVTGNNTAATNSTVPTAGCDGTPDGDVWFTTTVPASGKLHINTFADDLTDMGMAVYTGTCSSLTLFNCYIGGNATTSTMPYAQINSGLTPGATVWIRLWDVGNDESGAFSICAVDPCTLSTTITGPSTACSASNPQLCSSASTTYLWSTSATTQCINPSVSGTYTVTITDANGCTASDSHAITVNTNPTVSVTGPTSACLNTSPQLCSNTAFSSYSWSNGATTQCINPTTTGSYTVTVTAANSCTASASKTITVFPNFTPTVTGDDSSCTSSPGQLCSSAGSSYSWSSGQTTQCINPSSSGNYVVTVTNANGCTATASKTTLVYTNPTALITGPTSGCTGSNVQICANAGSFTYAWSNASTTSCINLTNTGTFSVTITDTHGCTSSDSHTVTFGSSISVSISGPANICSGSGTQICADAGFTSYAWSNGATTQCITPSTTGTYSVTVSDAGGCTATNSKSVTVNTPSSMSITGPTSGCANSFPQLCAAGGFSSYAWSSSETTQCIAPLNSGTYTVTGTDANGCTSSSSQSLTILPNPVVSITGSSITCPGVTTQLCAVTSGGTYLWSNGGLASCINVVDSGSYFVTITGVNGCTSSAAHVLANYAVPAPTITGPSNACFGSTVQLCAPSGMTAYSWSDGSTTQCINATTSGTYTATVTDANGCTSSASHVLTIGSNLNLSITGPAGVCPGQSVQLCASAIGTTLWSTGATTQCISPTTSGTYTVTVTDVDGCTGSASRTFTAYPNFSGAITGPTTACFNSNPQLCAPNGVNYQYVWSTGDSTRCINATASGIYNVVVTNQNGCTATGSKGLTIFSQLNATISGPNSLCTGAVGQLCAPTGSSLYAWSTGSTSRCINVNSTGNYTVTITDGNGCTASSSLPVTFSSSITTVISGSHTPCPGEPLQLCVPAGYTDYAWNTGATTECITVNSNGNYSVTIHDAVGCVGNDTHNVVFNSLPPVLIAGQTDLCEGAIGILCATSGYTTYLWSDSTDESCITVDTSGTYSVFITDSLGCSNETSVVVNLTNINPVISYSQPDLIATPTGLQYLYEWTYNGAPFSGTTNTVTPDHTGFYTVIITDQISGCIDSISYYHFMVGTNDLFNTQQIRIYPNPVSNEMLNIAFEFVGTEKISLQLTDALGQILSQEVFTKSGILTKQIRISNLAAGIYLVNIKGANWTKTWKVVKE